MSYAARSNYAVNDLTAGDEFIVDRVSQIAFGLNAGAALAVAFAPMSNRKLFGDPVVFPANANLVPWSMDNLWEAGMHDPIGAVKIFNPVPGGGAVLSYLFIMGA